MLDSRLIILWGWNPIVTRFGPDTAPALSRAKKAGAEIVSVDPRRNQTAKALGAKGIRTRLVVDSAAPSLMVECDVVVVGADAVTPEGVVNKIGTYALALAARERNVPFYVLAGTEKFLPFLLRIEERDPKEITQEAIPNGSVENRYFDCTPLDFITGVVTQEGVIAGKEIRRHVEGMKMSEGLQAR